MLTPAQETTLITALRAETNQAVVDALAIGNVTYLVEWCNGLSSADAWNSQMTAQALFEDSDITKFDGLSAGKRDAWRMMLDFAPIDFSKIKNRRAIQDVWGDTDSIPILQDCRRKATRGEVYLGGNSVTTNTVTALKLNREVYLSIDDIANAINNNNP